MHSKHAHTSTCMKHTIESSKYIENEYETIKLLNEDVLERHIREGFKFIHLGLIQVAIKPLHKSGIKHSLY